MNTHHTIPFANIPLDILQRKDLEPADKLVFGCLMMHALSSGRCWPSQETLATETALGLRTVKRSVQALVAENLIRVIRRRRKPALYEIVLGTTRITPSIEKETRFLEVTPMSLQENQEVPRNQLRSAKSGHQCAFIIEETKETEETSEIGPGVFFPEEERTPAELQPVLDRLALSVRPKTFATWFLPTNLLKDGDGLKLVVPSLIHHEHITENYMDLLSATVKKVLAGGFPLRVMVYGEEQPLDSGHRP